MVAGTIEGSRRTDESDANAADSPTATVSILIPMTIRKAVITAAGRSHRGLPLQTIVNRDGVEQRALGLLVDEAVRAGSEEVAVVVAPGDEETYRRAAGESGARLQFLVQHEPLGYGHAVLQARAFAGRDPILH